MLEPSLTFVPTDNASHLIVAINDLFSVDDVTVDYPEADHIRLRGTFKVDLADHYETLRARCERFGYTPLVREDENGRPYILALPHVYERREQRWLLNLVLFLATIVTTMMAGALQSGRPLSDGWLPLLLSGWPFSLSILLILGAHELGHYFAARYHKVQATLPYFIPVPPPFILGTMGAVIVQREPPKNRRALLDIGAAGPLVGLLFAIPILFIGLMTSDVGPLPPGGYMMEGNSLFYALAKTIVFGRFLPAGGIDVSLNQVAWAGWAGLLVTALNLLPVGQLDGGHMAFVLLGQRARRLFWPVIFGLAAIAMVTASSMWVFWILLLFLFGRRHPAPLDDVTPLDRRRKLIAYLALGLFFVLFTPIPLQIVG